MKRLGSNRIRLQHLNKRYRLNVPVDLVRSLGWTKGDIILFTLEGNNIVLEKENE